MDTSSFRFERLRRTDLPLLQRWLGEPHVARWWHHDSSAAGVEADFGPSADGLEAGKDFVASVDGAPIGFVQFSRFVDYPEYLDEMVDVYPVDDHTASIDYFIGEPELVGRGVGSAMLAAFTHLVWEQEPDVTHLVVPVNSANEASWRALQNAGFRRAARADMDPDNPADDRSHEIMRLDRVEIVRVGPHDADRAFGSIAADVFDVDPTPEQLRAFAEDPDRVVVVAVDRPTGTVVGQCVGHLLADVVGTGSLYVDNLGVAPTHQRRGVARRLVDDVLAWGHERGVDAAWLVAEADDEVATAFHRALGARESAVTMFELDVAGGPT